MPSNTGLHKTVNSQLLTIVLTKSHLLQLLVSGKVVIVIDTRKGCAVTTMKKGIEAVANLNPLVSVVRPAGFEPAACGFEVRFFKNSLIVSQVVKTCHISLQIGELYVIFIVK